MNFKSRYVRYFKWGVVSFAALFFFRLGYGYFSGGNDGMSENGGSFFSGIENLRKNYASEKMTKMQSPSPTPNDAPNFSSNQKYEKTASIKSKSSRFDQDKSGVDKITKDFQAVVQYEKNEGKKGSREIHLLIGVNPILFDSFYVEIQKIGELKATEITKVDKTNEFRQLNAQKVSLEKTLNSLNELKARGGAIGDYVSLHDKILEIEKQLQGLGVELGNFDSENEFCSIRFSLYEGATGKKISSWHRVKTALEWTLKYYAVAIFGLLCWSIFIFMLLFIIDRFNILKKLVEKTDD
ncbi:MAG: hypothetical protein RL757_1660 [Bacteroidota bacterium]|jgi:hypothetical protein